MKKRLSKLETIILTTAIYISFIGGMLSQLNHTMSLYTRLDPDTNILYAIAFSISFDLFVGVAIIVGWTKPAFIAALGMVLINLLHYSLFELTFKASGALLISVIQPAMVYAYAVLIHEQNSEPAKEYKKPGPKPKSEIEVNSLFSVNN